MTATGDVLLTALLAAFTACAGYVAGRLHQWYLVGLDRDEAYQDGFDTGTRSVFATAARMIGPRRPVRGSAPVVPLSTSPAAVEPPVSPAAAEPPVSPAAAEPEQMTGTEPRSDAQPRHRVPDELVQAATYRLPPDRIARAKVPGALDLDDADGQDAACVPPAIPRPRTAESG
ncbi:hypothetical protein [Actinoplanes sp. N902-109]|uniref:hypothetical protein n=1 Tax=Actinoplanes sp. (strain N902-109) TaxID=649831 RepID=UPI000329505E|nr:hypothetical protein [Actinoplanes sp. N902-109]AGL19994.1 hypothetical protein L083_6484 [Actinoplanes sp. N902-109]